MPYKVKEAEITLALQVGEIFDAAGKHIAYDHVSQTFYKDDVVQDDADKAKEAGQEGPLSPLVIGLYENGDRHTRAVIEKLSVEAQKRSRVRAAKDESSSGDQPEKD